MENSFMESPCTLETIYRAVEKSLN
uniref:Uncharacterized protein n=1 Tax=Rhizophora mucronata TaxID=61149 RepID=A0A2P2QKD7_RHIMU